MGLQRIALARHNVKDAELRFSGNYVIPSFEKVKGRISQIKNNFYKHIRVNKKFARRLIFCEILNLANLLLQIYCTNWFLRGQFYDLGIKFWQEDFAGRMDVLDTVFPKITKCDFYKYGQSGSIQRHDALCVMALNVVHEKIFVVLWFWYAILLIITIGSLIWRLMTLLLFAR